MQTAIVRHILVKDKDLAEQLKKRIQSGADFAKIAKQYSTCNSAKRGGDLGEVKKGQLVPVIDKLVFTAAERVLHGPIKSQFGFHLLEIKFRMDGLR
ncbi:peptidylprolyl isomerase [Acinetobacter venetianus]|jgi:peptidyl-prolyl cis-trans isomerase C|uniref:peptidylprolyl isomerase n=1 Tax=Acinetobacter venetianus TaxID=52133 RepID=A0A150HMN3_9GAMM|nr:peptidylprolyl isomerase [Acinetobacter venetianus]KXZ66647.1 Peptidyl-prolyl cis-trans isomerase C [Acinetobacter venetianus]KXZ68285.1 Peptidyl-prolyl cis-trans isomerase C [Acinetobacter venetianus]RZG86498.1 peptidylprolyl isomerase [Acinetobacter venetianus]